MSCDEFLDLLFEFRRRQLDRDSLERCRTHLRGCQGCRAEVADTEKFLSAVKACYGAAGSPAEPTGSAGRTTGPKR